MYAIGRCYRHGGHGVEKDRRKSCEWLIKASELGHADSTYLLAVCYQLGEGVDIDEAKAFELNVKAAELGHLMGTFNLGNLYRHGLCGVAEDKKEALKWFRVAFDIGYDRKLLRVYGHLRGICRMLEAELAATRTN